MFAGRLFETPTLAALADCIQAQRIAPSAAAAIKNTRLVTLGSTSGAASVGKSRMSKKFVVNSL